MASAWLLSLTLQPIVSWLSGHPIPFLVIRPIRRRLGRKFAHRLGKIHLSYSASVVMVYVGLLVITIVLAIFLIPAVLSQFSTLGSNFPRYISDMPDLLDSAQRELDKLNLEINLKSLYPPPDLTEQAQELGSIIAQTAFSIAARIANIATSLLLVYVLSFYMALDGRKLLDILKELIPSQYQDEVAFASQTIDRVFGAFIRGELLIGILYGLGAFMAMSFCNLRFSLAIASLTAFITLIPALGEPIAMLLPGLIALIQGSRAVIPLLIAMTAYQQVLLRVIMPRIMSEMVGMPSLLTLAAIMISVRLIGFWGFVFGIPVAGALYTMGLFFLERHSLTCPPPVQTGAGKQGAQATDPEEDTS